MKLILPKIKLSNLLWNLSRRLYPLALLVTLCFLAWLTYFLYQNVYSTLTQADIVSALKTEVSENSINKDKFYAVLQRIKDKTGQQTADFSTGRNPFTPLVTPEQK